MFKQRLLTTLILVPLVLLAIYYASPWLLGGIMLLITAFLGWEWLQLIPLKHVVGKCLFIVALFVLIWPASYWLNYWIVVDLMFWVMILFAVLTFPASQALWGHRAVVGFACLLLLPPIAGAISAVYQQNQGRDLIVYLLCLIWATDIGAYLAGKQWGRYKLIPNVSPGKTIEGATGGVFLAIVIAGMGYIYFEPAHVFVWFVVAIVTSLISMLGDLFISMLKRRSGLKDTGQIFPGHGGVLDRLDSLIAALPLFYFTSTLIFMGHIL